MNFFNSVKKILQSHSDAYRIIALGIILSLLYSLQVFLRSFRIDQFLPFIAVFEGFVLAVFFAWFIPKVNLRCGSEFILVWLSLFVIGGFSNLLGGYFFVKHYGSFESFVSGNLIWLFITFLQSAFAILLLDAKGEMTLTEALKGHMRTRTRSSWVKRMVAASVVYFPHLLRFRYDGGAVRGIALCAAVFWPGHTVLYDYDTA
jgi:hypothetical protein